MTLVEKVVATVIVAIFVLVIGSVLIPWRFSDLGEGKHTGQITAVDQRGYIFRNSEVYFKTEASSSQEDMYCIHRDDHGLVSQAKEAVENRTQVTITYQGVRGIGWGLCHAGQITAISEAK